LPNSLARINPDRAEVANPNKFERIGCAIWAFAGGPMRHAVAESCARSYARKIGRKPSRARLASPTARINRFEAGSSNEAAGESRASEQSLVRI